MNKLDELAGQGVMEEAFMRTAEEHRASYGSNDSLAFTSPFAVRKTTGAHAGACHQTATLSRSTLGARGAPLAGAEAILIASAVISFLLAVFDGEGWEGFVEPFVIVLILVANAAVGVITETNAEKAIEELKILQVGAWRGSRGTLEGRPALTFASRPDRNTTALPLDVLQADLATVVRGKRLRVVPAAELVPGDVIEVAVGGKVPSDARLVHIFSSQLRCDQAILTGESDSVLKDLKPCSAGPVRPTVPLPDCTTDTNQYTIYQRCARLYHCPTVRPTVPLIPTNIQYTKPPWGVECILAVIGAGGPAWVGSFNTPTKPPVKRLGLVRFVPPCVPAGLLPGLSLSPLRDSRRLVTRALALALAGLAEAGLPRGGPNTLSSARRSPRRE
eukprot:1195973-Prorocentrum_minimum.AAC.4